MRDLKVHITQQSCELNIAILLDDKEVYIDSLNFCDVSFAEGKFADLFHQLTHNRYKEPTEAIPVVKNLLKAEI
jgi:hypothetical protein